MTFALLDRLEERERRADLRAGELAAAVFNAQGGFVDRAARPGDFFPSLQERVEEEADSEATLGALAAAFGLPLVREGEAAAA